MCLQNPGGGKLLSMPRKRRRFHKTSPPARFIVIPELHPQPDSMQLADALYAFMPILKAAERGDESAAQQLARIHAQAVRLRYERRKRTTN